jgi:hypothetical protein
VSPLRHSHFSAFDDTSTGAIRDDITGILETAGLGPAQGQPS